MVNNKDFGKHEEEEKMAVMEKTVNQMYDIVNLKEIITSVRLDLLKAINIIRKNDVETITFDMDNLSDEEKLFLNTYHMMIEDQNRFVKETAHISYECLDHNEEDI